MAKRRNIPVTVNVKSNGGKAQEGLHFYVFDKEGQLKETTSIKNGTAKLKTPAHDIRGQAQIIIAPPLPKEFKYRKITPVLIKKMGGYQPSIRINPKNEINIIGLPEFKFPLWDWCLITGELSKTFTIDGESRTLPVCDARVHICEVDRIRWWWPKIPRPIIDDLAKKLKDIILIPEIDFPPIPDPGPKRIPRNVIDPKMKFRFNAPKTLPKVSMTGLPDYVRQGILSTSQITVHNTIRDNFHLLHPYICLWPWFWPYFYKCTEIATVQTDCNGNFDYNYLNFTNDKDIYIWVEVNIDGEWITVYRPTIACHTRWDYSCGSEINIRITDPRVRPCECEPIPGAIVWMKRVNTGVRMRNIQQNGAPSGHLTNAIGLTSFATSDNVSPFGGAFPFVVQFGSGFPNSTVTHYRWSYRKLKDAFLTNVTDTDHPLEGALNKNYTYEVTTPTGTVFATGSFPLGPTYDGPKPKYRIPHVEASDDVPAQPTAEWNQDTNSIKINSTDLTDGLYEFTFELLDASGNVVPVDDDTFVVDRISTDPFGPSTISANGLPENYLEKNGSGNVIAFRFKLRIDNQVCYADVLDALVDGNPTDAICGIGHYDDKVNDKATLKFQAGQPNDFATYSFNVTKGNSNSVSIANSNGYVAQINNGYTISEVLVSGISRDQYEKEMNVSAMLGSCNMAAFAEVLHVLATHTDGANRIHAYDRGDTAAIAMATS